MADHEADDKHGYTAKKTYPDALKHFAPRRLL